MNRRLTVLLPALLLAALLAPTAEAGPITYPPSLNSLRPNGATMTVSGRRVIDLGANMSGHIVIDVKRGSVKASYSESRRNLRSGGDMGSISSMGRDDAPGARADQFGKGVHRAPLRGGIRYVLLEGNAEIDRLGMDQSMIPSTDISNGEFKSNDALLNRIWRSGARTLELSTAKGPDGWVVTDAPKRDRLIWAGDLEMEVLSGTYVSREYGAALDRTLLAFACQQLPNGYVPMTLFVSATCKGQSTIPDGPTEHHDPQGLLSNDALPAYTASLISATKQRFMFNGNVAFVRRLLPVLQHSINYMNAGVGPDGLFRGGSINWRAFDVVQEADTYTNAAWVQALNDLAWLEDYLGLPAQAAQHRQRASALAACIRQRLFSPASGLFVGGLSDRLVAQDANVKAVLAGVTDDPIGTLLRLQSAVNSHYGPMTSATDSPFNEQYISPFMSGWQLLALLQHGRGQDAKTMIKRLWGKMANDDPGTMWEAMSLSGEPKALGRGRLNQGITSLAHGWSTAPTYALPAYVVGVRPTSPGWATWEVKPMPLGLKSAYATVWTPRGYITASWKRKGKRLIVNVEAPRGTTGVIASRCGRNLQIKRRVVIKSIHLCK